ncbi:EF-hand domain-containing protein D2 homolog [Homalodisca vitripennis]|uniref:EF-hand domain-containing protein D2 homolog n=1 Tax=Homalodisca vitripennis TaxID=197043 RepID=UPI001EEBE02D|nr:EF-hand domain-containing protein D2 homolog [Homalodisca vitripennis]
MSSNGTQFVIQFLLIFRKAKAGELVEESGLSKLAQLTEISVEEVGVGGAKNFFEAKIEELRRGSKFEDEIKQEQEERRRQEEEKAQRRIAFQGEGCVISERQLELSPARVNVDVDVILCEMLPVRLIWPSLS